MPDSDTTPSVEQPKYSSRLEFLYKIVEDTQNTIRFIDTKAAFCVTLLSGMVAAALQSGHVARMRDQAHQVLFIVFMLSVIFTLLVCLRVIFPTIKPHSTKPSVPGAGGAQAAHGPRFFIGHNKRGHWLLHTLRNTVDVDILSESHDSYFAALKLSGDEDLLSSMCDEVLMISLIRQIKSDRLHTAMFSLVGAVLIFCVLMID